MKPRKIHVVEGSHFLVEQDGVLALEIAVGTIAQYAVRMVLTAEEAASFRREGAAYVDSLARDVVRREPHYRALGRTEPL